MTPSSATYGGSTTEEYSFESVTAEHYPLLKILYKNAFHASVAEKEIETRFNTSSLGLPLIGFIAIHNLTNHPAAYYGVFPFKAIVNGEIVQAAQSGDTMTHSEHTRKGLFVKLALLTYEDCRKKGVKILIGQPNENSYHGLVNKLGWNHLDEVVRWDLKLRFKTFPVSKLVLRFPALRKFYSPYAKSILKKRRAEPDSFQNPLQTTYAKVNRDIHYLDYKKTSDKFFLQIDGITIWIRLTDLFWIGDFSDYEKITPMFIKKIKRLAFILGYNTISFNLNKSISLPPALQCFKKNGSQASCFLYLDEQYKDVNFILTAADSDTW